ncbi:TetR/AcrR family transcriptional regulator [Nocardia mangyaensis]|uniref:TetR/AcrR family transcriptional regulator n=1 Tax=Nocardia mangyaensis TaxID=2213200 RepID=UPI002675DA3B|nr:TetR/AcrR family transcriptional regulator [Nocardia mangyaensis]MDO3647956.1 helix-turn-helix domain-containing protein [Nocardia mangyaensis]
MRAEAETADGRQPRRRRDPDKTREAIIDGLLAAVGEGDIEPTSREIAARAGTSVRSVFVHFADRETLLVAAMERQSAMVEDCLTEPDPTRPLAERIALAVAQSAAIFTLQRTPRLAGLRESRATPAIDTRMRRTDVRIRTSLATLFAPELAAPDGTVDDELLDLVDGTLAWPMRHHLQDRRELTADQASTTIERALWRLLAQR